MDIFGISELKWTGMGEFNSDDHYIYYCGHEFLRRNGVAIMANKRQSQKWQNDLCSFPRQTSQYHSNPSLCPNQSCWRSKVERFYEDLQDLLELTPTKDVLFILGDWNAKVGSQETPGVTGSASLRDSNKDFPGGPVVKDLPANAGMIGLIPGLGRFHMPWGN